MHIVKLNKPTDWKMAKFYFRVWTFLKCVCTAGWDDLHLKMITAKKLTHDSLGCSIHGVLTEFGILVWSPFWLQLQCQCQTCWRAKCYINATHLFPKRPVKKNVLAFEVWPNVNLHCYCCHFAGTCWIHNVVLLFHRDIAWMKVTYIHWCSIRTGLLFISPHKTSLPFVGLACTGIKPNLKMDLTEQDVNPLLGSGESRRGLVGSE